MAPEIRKHIEGDNGSFAIYNRGSVSVTVWNLPTMKNRITISSSGLTTGRPLGHLIALLNIIRTESKLGILFVPDEELESEENENDKSV